MSLSFDECLPRIKGARVMVTGGAGFIGSHLVDTLIQHDAAQVVILDDLSRPTQSWLDARINHPAIHFVRGSILDTGVVEAALSGVQAVFHLAAISTVMSAVSNPENTFNVNALGTARLASAAQRAGARRFVFTSSREVYGDPAALPVAENAPLRPKNVYGASKAAGELYLQTLDPTRLEAVILRLANVYGTRDVGRVIPIFLDKALNSLPLVLYGGEQVLDFVGVDDVVAVLLKAAFGDAHIAEPVNIGGGQGTRLRGLAQRIIELVGSQSQIQVMPPRGPEVERYEADLTRALHYFGLHAKADPLDGLPDMLHGLQTEGHPINTMDGKPVGRGSSR